MTKRLLAAIMAFVLILSCVPALHARAADVSPTASGTTYYVSSLHGAKDNNGTSQATPFVSLLEINEITLQPGDRVLLERGSVFVDEYLHIKGSGSKDAPIIIDVYGDESQPKPLIQTNGNGVWYQDYGKRLDNTVHKYQGNVSSCILLFDVEYIEISNIAMTNEGNFAAGEVYNSLTRYDRTGVAGIAQNIGTVDHIYLRNLDIRNVQGHVRNKHMANGGIYLLCHNPSDVSATGPAKFHDVLIEGCRLDEVNRWGIAVGYTAHWDQFQYGPTIDADICQTYGSTDVIIRNNYLTNVGGDGITTMYCYQPVIEYNVLDGYCQDMTNEIYGPSDGQLVAAGIWPWMCKTAILQYNEAYNSTANPDGQAWDADWGDNAIYQYNYSCNNAGGAIMFCGAYACNTVFRYNISQNDLAGVLNLASSPNGEIYNNVFYIKEGVKINRTGMSGGKGNTVYNNIFYYSGSKPADATLGNWGDITAQWSNNVYYNYETIPADAYAITADPMFVDPGKGPTGAQDSGLVHNRSVFDGYKLKDGSPAIDAGMPMENNGGKDFFGNEVDMLPDIGAYDAGTCNADASKAVVVDLDLGETITLTDTSGDYSGTTPTVDNEKIASVVLTKKESVAQTTVSSTAATNLEAGASYQIRNANTGSAVTNVQVDAPAWGTRALQLISSTAASDSTTWTLEASGSNYKIKSANGSYLMIDLNASSLGTGDVFTAATSGGSDVWTFRNSNGYYLDNLGRMDFLGGWTEVGNSSTWKLYKITTSTLDAATELTFTGLYPGTANIVVGDTLYQVRVSGKVQEVALKAGETATFTDNTGNYTDADTKDLNTAVATVVLSGAMTDGKTLGSAVTSLTSGGKYILVNTRAKKPVTNAPATAAAAAGAGSGLNLTGSKEDLDDTAIWTITGSNGSFTVQDQDGKYMTVASNSAGITSTATQLELNYNGSTWTIARNSAYLNDFGGKGTCAAGWQDYSASYDSGSQWDIYQVNYTSGENGTQITFTGVGNGETSVMIGDILYHITVTGGTCSHPSYTNGFCDACDAYEPAQLVDGVYQIGNGGQLYWFARLVDDGALDADAVLTADITVNQDVLLDGELNEDGDFRSWNPIGSGSQKYAGTFGGQDHSISGLYYDKDGTLATHVGLFATLDTGAVVENVHLKDSFIAGESQVGGIAGRNLAGTIRGCSNSAVITGYGSDVGGIAGINQSTIFDCTNSGAVTGENENVGGIAGRNAESTVQDLACTIQHCANTGSVKGTSNKNESYVGGILGRLEDGSVIDCYNAGAVSAKGEYVGGVVGVTDGKTIRNCHNVGSVSGKASVGPILGGHYSDPTMTNCYYLADSETDSYAGTTFKTEAQFASGEVTWLLNGSTDVGELVWFQIIGEDEYPIFEGAVVHHDAGKEPPYFNVGVHKHDWVVTYEFAADGSACTAKRTCAEDASHVETATATVTSEVTKAPTCDTKGETTYTATFTEDWAETQTLVVADIAEKGHAYGAAEYTWSEDGKTCTAKRTCANDATHEETATATVTSEVTKAATCEAKGETTYTATFTEDWAETQTKTLEDVAALGHAYGDPVIVWNEDNTASASVTCANDKTHVIELEVKVTSETTEGDCKTKAVTTYVATVEYNGKTYTDAQIVEGELGEHTGDTNNDHKCDLCGAELSKCEDTDPEDHKCDICGKVVSECADKDNDHKCDVCDKVLSECVDENKDYKCDICGKDLEKPEDPSDPVEEEEVIRLAGSHRWETALKVADEMKANLGVEKFDSIIIASGNDFADALAGSYLSTVKNAPILLGWGKGGKFEYLDTDNIEYIKANLAEGGTVYILGGKNAVPELYENELKGYNVKRLGGANRFETNLLILAEAGVKDGSEILVCTSTNFADSLSASATAKPILLVFNEYGKLYGKQPEFLSNLKNCTFTVIGGESAVSADLAKAIETYGKVERLAGANRFETSVLVAQKYFKDVDTAVLAYAWNYPDGLCGGSLAYSLKAPLILTMTKYEAKAVEYAKAAGIETGLVLGGETLISDEAVRSIFAMDAADEIIEK